MSFGFFQLLAFTQFFLGGIWLFSTTINSVEDIIIGFIILWGTAVVLLAVRSTWNKFTLVADNLKRIPQSESYRTSLATGFTSFVLSVVLLGTVGEVNYQSVFWFIVLFWSIKQLVDAARRVVFQVKVTRRFERRRKYLRLKKI